MPRPVLLLACALALVTGSALLAMGAAIPPPAIPGSPAGGDRIALVRAFYDAANEVLATGDPAPLDGIVASDLVEHPVRLGGDRGRDGLVGALRSRHAMFPGLRLVVDDVRPSEPGLVVARVRVAGTTAGAFLGLPLPGAFADWGPLDLFRIADGQIVEHWGSRSDSLLGFPLGETELDVEAADPPRRMVAFRTRLAPGDEVDAGERAATAVVFVDAGTIEVIDGTGLPRAASSGESLVLPARTHATLRNRGDAAAVLLTIEWLPLAVSPLPLGLQSDPGNPGQVRAGNGTPVPVVVADVPMDAEVLPFRGRPRLAVGRIVLAPDAVVPIPAGERLLLVAVEDGRLEVVTSSTGTATQTSLAGGGEAIVKIGAGSTLRSGEEGPTSLLVIAISPVVHGAERQD